MSLDNRTASHIFEIVAFDAEERPILVVEVRDRHGVAPSVTAMVRSWVESAPPLVPYAMLVDLDWIEIFRAGPEAGPARLPTAEILKVYDPEFDRKPIYAFYLATLVAAWLKDLAFGWKSDVPPGKDLVAQIGLGQRLHDGDVRSEVRLGAPALS